MEKDGRTVPDMTAENMAQDRTQATAQDAAQDRTQAKGMAQDTARDRTQNTVRSDDPQRIIWKDRKHHLWFPLSFTKYTVKNNRLLLQTGFFNSQLDETLLYRIVDLTMNQSLLGKLFGTGNIKVTSRVDTNPVVILENIKHPAEVYEILSDAVENSRKTQNVVGKEFYGSRGPGGPHLHHGADCEFHEFHDGGMPDFDGDGHETDGQL